MALNANTVLLRSYVKGGKALLRFSGTGTVQIAANSTNGNSDIGNPTANDGVTGASITGMTFSLAGNTVTIARGANTILTLAPGQAAFTQSQGWMGDQQFAAGTLVVTFNTSAAGFLELELSKQYAGSNPPLD